MLKGIPAWPLLITTHLPRRDIVVCQHHPAPALQHPPAKLLAEAHGGAGDDVVLGHVVFDKLSMQN